MAYFNLVQNAENSICRRAKASTTHIMMISKSPSQPQSFWDSGIVKHKKPSIIPVNHENLKRKLKHSLFLNFVHDKTPNTKNNYKDTR